jgi:hypothetical protein
MEQSGRNRYQAVANGRAVKTPERGENRCRRLRPVAAKLRGHLEELGLSLEGLED